MVFWPNPCESMACELLRSKIVEVCAGRLVNIASRSSCFGRRAVSCHFAVAASAFIALIDWNSFSATTARKLPSRTTLTTPGSFSTAAVPHSVCCPQILDRQTKPPCCFRNQKFARLRRRILDRGAAVLHGVAACRIALVRGQARVRRRHLEGFEGNIELLSRDLLKRRLEALTEFGLAREHLNTAIGVDADPRVEIG